MSAKSLLRRYGFSRRGRDLRGRFEFYNPTSVWPWIYGCGPTGNHNEFTLVNTFDEELTLDYQEMVKYLDLLVSTGQCEMRDR
jgi:hypothetical protein